MTRYKEGIDASQFAETQHQLIPSLPPINNINYGNANPVHVNQTDGFDNLKEKEKAK